MKPRNVILLCVASLCVGCSSTSYIATDDVYYWPEAHHTTTSSATTTSASTSSATTSNASTSSTTSRESAPSVEYLNVQDTVVTIRVKK